MRKVCKRFEVNEQLGDPEYRSMKKDMMAKSVKKYKKRGQGYNKYVKAKKYTKGCKQKCEGEKWAKGCKQNAKGKSVHKVAKQM